ncbi:hypothetical protein PMAYCL1PPCAC_17284, partial [Pristionchus mayeri]
ISQLLTSIFVIKTRYLYDETPRHRFVILLRLFTQCLMRMKYRKDVIADHENQKEADAAGEADDDQEYLEPLHVVTRESISLFSSESVQFLIHELRLAISRISHELNGDSMDEEVDVEEDSKGEEESLGEFEARVTHHYALQSIEEAIGQRRSIQCYCAHEDCLTEMSIEVDDGLNQPQGID